VASTYSAAASAYDARRKLVGALGVSGDTSCADHMIGWRLRNRLNFDYLQGMAGVAGDAARPDNIVYDIKPNPNGGAGERRQPRSSDVPQYGRSVTAAGGQ